MASKENKLDIFRVLDALDRNDLNFYGTLTDAEKKAFSPWLVMRWASSVPSQPEHYLLMVNDLVNENFSDFSAHPELQWKLLATCGIGRSVRHKWIPVPKKEKASKLHTVFQKLRPHYKSDEIDIFLKLNTEQELTDCLKDAGYPDKEIADLIK